MIYGYKISKAIAFSIKTHEVYQKQKRKGKDIPYITHPLTVGLILSRAGADEDIVVAGILHDTIEDSVAENKVSQEMLEKQFGKEVAGLVQSVSETNKGLSWEERKHHAIEDVKFFSLNSILVKSADIISNATELIEDYEQDKDAVFQRFNASKEKILLHYLRIITALIDRWGENPLSEDLRYVARQLQIMGALQFMPLYPAKIIDYAEYNDNTSLVCYLCGWKGTPKESGWINTDSHFCLDVSCPNCEKMLLVANYSK